MHIYDIHIYVDIHSHLYMIYMYMFYMIYTHTMHMAPFIISKDWY